MVPAAKLVAVKCQLGWLANIKKLGVIDGPMGTKFAFKIGNPAFMSCTLNDPAVLASLIQPTVLVPLSLSMVPSGPPQGHLRYRT